jgi:diadenosine tetraphosphate (Ap4A) HIT family hydrolase
MALRLKMSDKQVKNVSMGAMLHDIGLRYIKTPYMNTNGTYMNTKDAIEYKKHTIFGYSSVQDEDWIPDIAKEIILLHHERIDGNRSKLGSDEAKFYMLSLNSSQAEQVHLIGREVNSLEELTPEERQAVYRKLEKFTRSAMDEYARNFQREAVKDGGDLMYYARIETKRTFSYSDEEVKKGLAKIGDVKPGLNLHVHVIVSRKSKNGKVKLSPAAKSAGNSWELEGRGTVKRGFSHENWKVSVQQCFDREFQYQVVQSDCFVRPAVPDTISNPELRSLLQQQQFTAANQIVAAMKELGFTHQVRRGVHTFSRQGESFQVSHKELKTFECPLSDARIRDIADRFDLTRYEADS